MKILWFPSLQDDIDKLHITTWREMCGELEQRFYCNVKIAIAGKPASNVFDRSYISIPIIRKKFLRILTFLIFGYLKFLYNFLTFSPQVVILDLYSIWFSIPFAFLPRRRTLFIVDNRTPFYNVGSENDTMKDRLMRYYAKLSYQYCKLFLDGMTVITDYYKQQVCKDFGFNSSHIGVWGSGVDVNKFLPEKYNICERPSFLKDRFVIMQHGQISYNRGLFETVEALSMVKQDNICLVLIGDAVAGSKAKNDILTLIKDLDLEKSVYILPPVLHSEIPKYISYSDCAVMAYPNIEYWNNNNPIKLLEYIAMGKVVICTDMWTFKDVMNNQKCAYYIKNNNPQSIADAIEYCYENRGSLEAWGTEGIQIVEERYTWHKQAERLCDFIGQLNKSGSLTESVGTKNE